MPSKEDHLTKAEHNKGVMQYLLERKPGCPDWVVTVAFYCALHLVDALLACDKDSTAQRHPHDHNSRERVLKQNRYKAISKHYLPLKNASIIARYLSELKGRSYRSFSDYMGMDRVRTTIINHRLLQIEKSVRHLLSQK